MKALIIVDPQRDFMPGGNLAVKDGNKIIPYINKIIENYPLVIVTLDSHPKNHGSFASNNDVEPFTVGELNGLLQVFWPDHCIIGTEGHQIHKNLKHTKAKNLVVITKGTDPEVDSYSAFYDNGKKNKTELSDILKEHSVNEIDVVGLATDFCVKYTAMDGISEGFKVNILLDGCRSINKDISKDIEEMKKIGVKIK